MQSPVAWSQMVDRRFVQFAVARSELMRCLFGIRNAHSLRAFRGRQLPDFPQLAALHFSTPLRVPPAPENNKAPK